MIVKVILLPVVVFSAALADIGIRLYNWSARRAGTTQVDVTLHTR